MRVEKNREGPGGQSEAVTLVCEVDTPVPEGTVRQEMRFPLVAPFGAEVYRLYEENEQLRAKVKELEGKRKKKDE